MKRFISVLLTACIIAGLLTGCGKSNWELYKDAVSSFNNNDLEFTMELAVEGENAFTSEYLDSDSFVLMIDGGMAAGGETAEMGVSLKIPSVNTTVELTDIIMHEKKMYMNFEKLFTVLTGGTEVVETLMDGKSYILLDLEEDMNMDKSQLAENVGLITMFKNISDIYETVIQDKDAVSKDGSTYSLTLDGSSVQELVLAVIEDIQGNKETYYDSICDLISQMYTDDILEPIGFTIEEMEDSKEEALTDLDVILAELKDSIKTEDFSETSYTSKVDDKSLELSIAINMGDELNLKYSYSAKKADMGSVQIPENYITMSEYTEIINALNEFDYSDPPTAEAENGDSISANNGEIRFNVKKGDSNPQIFDADLSGYTYLTNYSLESDISGEVYNVPVIDGGLNEETGYVESYSKNKAVYLSSSCIYMLGDDFLAYCEESFQEDYELYGEYGYEARYSDAYVSADGNTVVIAIAYDLGNNYICTDVYVYQYINNRELLYGVVNIENDYMDETESAILAECGQLLDFDLTQFFNLFNTASPSII